MSKEISLINSDLKAIVSNKDFERVNKYKWLLTDKKYVRRNNSKLSLHRFILNAPKNKKVDHKFHNTLDNRRSKLRLCTHAQNMANMKPHKGGTSKYKGVIRISNGSWIAHLTVDYVPMYLGIFKKEKHAALSYDKAALYFRGKFAKVNFKKSTPKDHIRTCYVDYDPPRAKGEPCTTYKKKKHPYDCWRKKREKRDTGVTLKKIDGKVVTHIKIHGKYGNGKYAIADKEDFERIKKHKWYGKTPGYYRRKKFRFVYLHRFVMRAKKGQFVDHKYHDHLDARKKNLRIATSSQNQANKIFNQGTSKYKGVRKTPSNKWRASIEVKGRFHDLGTFKKERRAALEYDKYAVYLFGEFAYINFPNIKHSKTKLI